MRIKKLAAVVMAAICALSVTGCGGARSDVEIDTSRTTLTVGNFNGGVGSEWLESAIKKFEEKYKDVSFEEGKKGVQVIIGSNNKTTMVGETLKDLVLTEDTKDEVFFTESVYYNWWVKNNKMLDITEYVTSPLTEFGEDKSIADKMDADYLKNLKIDDKVYALPFWNSSYCFVYNATLFDEKGWYMTEDGKFTNSKGQLGAGPDGKKGTYDDGMPATYDDFFALLEKIKKDGCTPFQAPGASQDYVAWMIGELAADNMGYDQFMLNYTFDGEANLVKTDSIDWDKMTYKTEKVKITQNNGYELARQPGVLHAVDFAEKLLQNTSYYDANKTLSGSFKIAQSQLEFVRNTSISGQTEVAIMLDGTWWENEAVAAFKETYGKSGTKYDSDMEYKVMPLPKATKKDIGSENIMVSALDTYCFIKANIAPEKIDVATKFLQFVHTDAQMEEFTKITGIVKPYDYDINTDELTSFTKSVIDMTAASRVALPMDNNDLYSYSPIDFRLPAFVHTKYAPEKEDTDAIVSIMTEQENNEYKYSTKDYFNGIVTYRKEYQWDEYKSILK